MGMFFENKLIAKNSPLQIAVSQRIIQPRVEPSQIYLINRALQQLTQLTHKNDYCSTSNINAPVDHANIFHVRNFNSFNHQAGHLTCPNAKLYKTELCQYWCNGSPCKFGNACWFAHGPQDLQAFSAKVAEKGKSKSSGHRNKRKNKCFSRSSVLFNNKKPSNVWDSGILSDICSPIGSSIPSLDKEPMFSSLPCPSNGTDCHSVTDHGVNLKDLQFGMASSKKDFCEMYVWCGFCVMGNACPYVHSQG
ncbi:unnamed protein product [Enterobius vermicularis]|uniref:C3H1-type domain-containing protein n=1 Tax=Enterobius vermicularis TaxID=51028 RepID=A0A0N4V541_ENTVE|nr:unnamed protein product [Enterobius vermicularis]